MFGDADASTPAIATANSGSVATTGSFTPPDGSVIIAVDWHDTASGNTSNTSAITGGSLSWTQTAVRNKADSGGQNGRVSLNWAVVGTGASMTVTTTGTNCAGACGVYARVITGIDTTTPIDVVNEGSNASAAVSVTFTIVTTGARAFVANVDWNVAATPTPNTGITTVIGQGIGAGPDVRAWYASKDATSNASDSVTMSSSAPTTGNTNNFIGWALRPATAAADIPYNPQHTIQVRDYAEAPWLQRDRRDANTVASAVNNLPSPLDTAWQDGARYWHLAADTATRDRAFGPNPGPWIQRDRRDANTVGSAANPLPSPLDSAWQDGGRYWHLYNDQPSRTRQPQQRAYASDPSLLVAVDADPTLLGYDVRRISTADYSDRREVPQQRPYVSNPTLLTTALLENELLGGGDAVRHQLGSPHLPRWWMPEQPKRDATSPGLLDTALLENELLGGADTARHGYAAVYTDRREVPQQRAYVSDPLLLTTALLEGALLGGASTAWHAFFVTDRRSVPQQPPRLDFAGSFLADPLALDGDRRVRLFLAATHADRRITVPQRLTLLFVGIDAPPTVKATSTSDVSAGRQSTTTVVTVYASIDAVTARRTSSGGVA